MAGGAAVVALSQALEKAELERQRQLKRRLRTGEIRRTLVSARTQATLRLTRGRVALYKTVRASVLEPAGLDNFGCGARGAGGVHPNVAKFWQLIRLAIN